MTEKGRRFDNTKPPDLVLKVMSMKLHCLPIALGFIVAGAVMLTLFPCHGVVMAQENYAPPVNHQEYVPTDQNYDSFLRNITRADKTGIQNADSYYGGVIFNRVLLGLTRLMAGDMASSSQTTMVGDNGLLGATTNLFSLVYANPPASGVTYVADLGRSAHIIPAAYADDNVQGYTRIRPLLELWKATRDVAYIMYIPIFIFVGITIMLRQKINPQTVASVQAAIPKIILSLVLVTLSFAIAGFMIDVMNFTMALILNYFKSRGLIKPDLLTGDDAIYNKNLIGFTKDYFRINNLADFAADAVNDIVSSITHVGIPGLNKFLGDVAGGLAKVILLIAVLFVLFRTLITLIMAYISVLLMIIMAPLVIVWDAIPGRNGFNFWFKNILANLAVFPAVLALLLFGAIIGGVDNVVGDNKLSFVTEKQITWLPPFLGSVAGNGIDTFRAFIGFGILLAMPTMLGQIQKFLKAGVGLGPILEPVTTAAQPITGALSQGLKMANQETPWYRAWQQRRVNREMEMKDRYTPRGGGNPQAGRQ